MNSRSIKLEKPFQVFVGIDFGTDGTGVSYALPTGQVFIHEKWKGYKRSVEVKPKTRILLDENGEFLAFGQPAINSYITMGSTKSEWMLFDRFKMSLYDTQLKNGKTDVDLNPTITAENGREWPAESVFIQALKYIKSQVFTYLKKNRLNITKIEEIQWILTVPAIWSERAKYKMEQWALKAELININIPNHLKIVYEPDCASLSIQYEIQQLKEIEMRQNELGVKHLNNKKRLSTFQINSVKKEKKKKRRRRRKRKKQILDDQKSEENGNEIEQEICVKEMGIENEKLEVENVNEVIEDGVNEDINDDDIQEREESVHSQPLMEESVVDDGVCDGHVVNDDNKDDDVSQINPKNEIDENEIKPVIDDRSDTDDEDEIILFSDDDENEEEDDEYPENEQNDENVNDQEETEEHSNINKMNEDNKELEEEVVQNIPDEGKEESSENQSESIEDQSKTEIIENQQISNIADVDDKQSPLQLESNDDSSMNNDKQLSSQPILQGNNPLKNEESDDESYEEYTDTEDEELEEDDDKINTHWLKGERYILMDAGGGTCDVACHEILGEYAVKEVVHPTGGAWGSTYIDDHFMQLLNKIFSSQWMIQFRSEDPSAFTELRENFRIAKQEFWKNEKNICQENIQKNENISQENKEIEEENNNKDEKIELLINKYKNKWHNMQLPFDFLSFLQERIENMDDEVQDLELETLVSHTNIHGHYNLIELEDEYLKLNYFVWTHELFDKVLDPILNHCRHLLCNTKMKDTTNYICIVGGLGSSKYLQHRITDEFGPLSKYKISIIVPSRPILTVVEGAARFGLQPDYIQSRTLAKTYGNAIDPKLDAIDVNALPAGYLVNNQYSCDHSGIMRVRNIFSVYAKKNDDIHIHAKPIVRKYKRFNVKQKKVRISVYTSDLEDPKVVVGRPVAKTTVVFPDHSTELSIIVELFFGDTKIRVYAYPENEPLNRKEMELEYEYC